MRSHKYSQLQFKQQEDCRHLARGDIFYKKLTCALHQNRSDRVREPDVRKRLSVSLCFMEI